MPQTAHAQRIKQELLAAGITKYGLLKLESRYLPRIIHPDEHIGGIAYGRYKKGSAMLIATNKRVVFLDRIPGYTNSDEITYDVVSGVKRGIEGRFSAITLHTRLGDYKLRFVNHAVAGRFVEYIEQRRLEVETGASPAPAPAAKPPANHKTKPPKEIKNMPQAHITSDEETFLLKHDLAVLSTIDRGGRLHGAVIYYVLGENDDIYFITKENTSKAHDILANPQVALTIFDPETLETAQMSGVAYLEGDANVKQTVFQRIVKPRQYGQKIKWPPVAKLADGSYVVFGIKLTEVKFRDYS